jgi:glycosyltransferase involved in cell wall biosynthesis
VYNGAKYLAAAMDSVQAQEYADIVHIVLDNASTDDTPDIIARYQHSRIKVVSYRNEALLPLPENWDKAFSLIPREATYAKLLCADDLMRKDCIRKFVELAEADPAIETVSCQDVHDDTVRRANIPEGVLAIDGKDATRAIVDRTINWLPFQHLFVRLHPDDFERPFFGTGELGCDPHAVARSALRGKFGYLHEPLVYTRWHKDSVSNTLTNDGRTPIYAVQINNMLMTYYKMLLVFGPKVWAEADFRKARRFAALTLARTILRWRLRGFRFAAEELERLTRSTGLRIGVRDYVLACLTVPGYLLWKRGWHTEMGPAVQDSAFFLASMV